MYVKSEIQYKYSRNSVTLSREPDRCISWSILACHVYVGIGVYMGSADNGLFRANTDADYQKIRRLKTDIWDGYPSAVKCTEVLLLSTILRYCSFLCYFILPSIKEGGSISYSLLF